MNDNGLVAKIKKNILNIYCNDVILCKQNIPVVTATGENKVML